jgi:hypothetical protein
MVRLISNGKCQRPFFIKDKKRGKTLDMHYREVLVPCGKCPGCLQARASAWSFRLMQEFKVSSSAFFITITYDSDYVPITENGYLSIRKTDLQKLFKRMRKRQGRRKLKYYAVGEYGGKLKRPHYHIILFNADVRLLFDKQTRLVLDAFGMDGKTCVHMNDWSKGHITVGSVSEASVGYVLKYISKPVRDFRLNDDRERPFSVMSKHLGINYVLNQQKVKWHKDDLTGRMYVNLKGGKKLAMPRYYKEKIYSDCERYVIKKELCDEMTAEIYDQLRKYTLKDIEDALTLRRIRRDVAIQQFNQIKNSTDYAKSTKGAIYGAYNRRCSGQLTN